LIGLLSTSALFTIALQPEWFWLVLHVVFSLMFFACICLRLLACNIAGEERNRKLPIRWKTERPVYSVLIALYKKAEVVPQIIGAMNKLNWPRSKLEVLFLCEADDVGTIAAFGSERLAPGFRVVPIPTIGPRTKPKALNYGLQLAQGEFVVVYDAEDRPHPDQLLEAWERFTTSKENLGCLQAPLVIANAHEGWLSRLFAFEYAAHFFGLLPWLARNQLVLPLGGSSNHFRRGCLEAVGGWDPFNMTEDAELGTRLARNGFLVKMLVLPTVEDAPNEAGVWLRQRTRWLKGWMQTFLVEMRHPRRFLADLGLGRFLVYHMMTAGLVLSSLLYPFMLVFIGYSAINLILTDTTVTNRGILLVDCMNITLGYLSFHALGRRSAMGRKIRGPILRCLPLYWLMMSGAAWRAVSQLCTKPRTDRHNQPASLRLSRLDARR